MGISETYRHQPFSSYYIKTYEYYDLENSFARCLNVFVPASAYEFVSFPFVVYVRAHALTKYRQEVVVWWIQMNKHVE